ncbi:MAG: hypothetical protein HKN23_09240 [Verrucomicrobiales bacterium]|nr:hypothetical protein [Verrucomicrobiales bacterium]
MKFSRSIVSRLLAGCVVLASASIAQQSEDNPDVTFVRANTAFENRDFVEAERLYRKLITSGQVAEDVFFNLGNSVARQGRDGEAALWFHRARVLDPRMPEANQNLAFLEKKHGLLKVERDGLEAFLQAIKPSEITAVIAIGWWIFGLALAATIVIRRLRDWRPLMIIVALFGLGLALAAMWGEKKRTADLAIENFGIIIGEGVAARTAPGPNAEEVISLPPGSEVEILQKRGPTTYVSIPGELRGFVDSEHVKQIWPID